MESKQIKKVLAVTTKEESKTNKALEINESVAKGHRPHLRDTLVLLSHYVHFTGHSVVPTSVNALVFEQIFHRREH